MSTFSDNQLKVEVVRNEAGICNKAFIAGIYNKASKQVNGRDHWIRADGNYAIWSTETLDVDFNFRGAWGPAWVFGNSKDVGSKRKFLFNSIDSKFPYETEVGRIWSNENEDEVLVTVNTFCGELSIYTYFSYLFTTKVVVF